MPEDISMGRSVLAVFSAPWRLCGRIRRDSRRDAETQRKTRSGVGGSGRGEDIWVGRSLPPGFSASWRLCGRIRRGRAETRRRRQ